MFGLVLFVLCCVVLCWEGKGREGVRKRYPNDKNYSVANPFGLQYASQAPVRPLLVDRENTLKNNTSRYCFGTSSKISLCMVPKNTSRNVEMSEVLFSFFKMSK